MSKKKGSSGDVFSEAGFFGEDIDWGDDDVTMAEEDEEVASSDAAHVEEERVEVEASPSASPAPVDIMEEPQEPVDAAAQSVDEEVSVADAPDESVSAVVATPPQLERWEPTGNVEMWHGVAQALTREAAVAPDALKGQLFFDAGMLYVLRLGDNDAAYTQFQNAQSAGFKSQELLRELIQLAQTKGNWAEAIMLLTERARLLGGESGAELLQDAALLADQHLNQPEIAAGHLETAIETSPGNYSALSNYRDKLRKLGRTDERIVVLGKLAELTNGGIASEVFGELGRLHQELGQNEAAAEAYEAGRNEDPSHGPNFVALEHVYRSIEEWAKLGALYAAEAKRSGPEHAEWWLLRAARAHLRAGDKDSAASAFKSATKNGSATAHRAYQAFLTAEQEHAGLAKAMEAELKQVGNEDVAAAALWYRLGLIKERHLDDPNGALKAYKNAVSCDPSAVPVSEAVARVMLAAGKTKQLIKFWETMLEGGADVATQVSIRFRMGEIAESGLSDLKLAKGFYESILQDHDPHFMPALESLQRVYRKFSEWEKLAGVFETLAELSDAPADKAQHLTRAGNVCRYESKNLERAAEYYKQALETVPGYANALEEYLDLLESGQEWVALADALCHAAENHGADSGKVNHFYRAGRVYADRLQDFANAAVCFQKCRELAPEFLPAMFMLKQIAVAAGETSQVYDLYRSQASAVSDDAERHWWLLAAADMASDDRRKADLAAILAEQPQHPGAFLIADVMARSTDDWQQLLHLYRNAAAEGASGVVYGALADISDQIDDVATLKWALEALANSESGVGRPAARLAESRQQWSVAAQLLQHQDSLEDRTELARLQAKRLNQAQDALATYKELMNDETAGLAAALGAARVGQELGDPAALQQAHAVISSQAKNDTVRATHALWTAQLLEAAQGDIAEIGAHYQTALDVMGGIKAFEGVRRWHVAEKDSAALRALYAAHRPTEWQYLVSDLVRIGDAEGAVDVLQTQDGDEKTSVSLYLQVEAALTEAEDWSGLYAILEKSESLFSDEENLSLLAAKKRWVLAEKLAETEEAWELYQRLHEQNPTDNEVTEALARIAGARGETEVAIQYLSELAANASGPAEAGRYQIRIGEAYEAAEKTDEARQAYINALAHLPSDLGALGGLKRIAESEGDWPALVQVLQREVGILDGEAQLDQLRRIAQISEEHLDADAVAIENWRKVLDVSPADRPALVQITHLSQASEDWGVFVEFGAQLAQLEEGERQADLRFDLGIACLEHLKNDDGLAFLAEAMRAEPPHLAAASALKEAYASRGNWAGIAECLSVSAAHCEEEARLPVLEELAELASSKLQDTAMCVDAYERIVQEDGGHVKAIEFLSDHYLTTGVEDKAAEFMDRRAAFVEEGVDIDDFDVRMELSTFHFQRGQLLGKVGRIPEAVHALERALELNASHAPSLRLIGPFYTAEQNWSAAERVYRQLLQLTGGMGDKAEMAGIYTQLGNVEIALNSTDKASKRFNKALELYPNHVGALKGMAALLETDKQWEQLLTVHNNIIYHGTDPQDVIQSYMTKGRILDTALDRAAKAAQHYVRSLQIDPNQPIALLRLAELALRREEWYEAGGYAQRGLQLVSESGLLKAELLISWAAAKLGSGDEAGAQAALVDAKVCNPALKGELDGASVSALCDGLKHRVASMT